LLGWVLLAQDKSIAQLLNAAKAIRLKPGFAEAHINLANAFVQKHDLDGALREAETAVRTGSKHPDAHRIVGRCFKVFEEICREQLPP
jgi:hypothetical protein